MSRLDSAATMFLRSGDPLPTPSVDGQKSSQWGHSVVHCSGCDFAGSDEHNVPNLPPFSDSWHGDGREWGFRENSHLKQSYLRTSLPPQCDGPHSSSPFLLSLNPQAAGVGATRMHSLADCGIKALQFLGSFSGSLEGRMSSVQKSVEMDRTRSQYTQELIRALQMGGSRTKMEAAIAVRSLAASHNVHQAALIAAGGLRPLVDLLSYEARETHWPPEMREKATITVRAEAALALASLSVSNDDNKGAIGAAGAIPLLCDLIQSRTQST